MPVNKQKLMQEAQHVLGMNGFTFEVLGSWCLRVHLSNDDEVDIWPTTGKYRNVTQYGKTQCGRINEVVEYLLKREKQIERNRKKHATKVLPDEAYDLYRDKFATTVAEDSIEDFVAWEQWMRSNDGGYTNDSSRA